MFFIVYLLNIFVDLIKISVYLIKISVDLLKVNVYLLNITTFLLKTSTDNHKYMFMLRNLDKSHFYHIAFS